MTLVLTTSADAALPAFSRACLQFAERAQAAGTLEWILGDTVKAQVYYEETARFRQVALTGLLSRFLLEADGASAQ
jgi:hypothetical protein